MDAFSRPIIGWSIAGHMRTELVTDALGMGILRRSPERQSEDGQTVLHSDHGTQHTSWAFGQRLRAAGLLASMGTVGDCYDNATMESFWGTLHLELLDTRQWTTRDELAKRGLRMDRVLVQPETPEFQHWNAQPGHVRAPVHQARPRPLTPPNPSGERGQPHRGAKAFRGSQVRCPC